MMISIKNNLLLVVLMLLCILRKIKASSLSSDYVAAKSATDQNLSSYDGQSWAQKYEKLLDELGIKQDNQTNDHNGQIVPKKEMKNKTKAAQKVIKMSLVLDLLINSNNEIEYNIKEPDQTKLDSKQENKSQSDGNKKKNELTS